jgi:RNA polymerase sigma factor (sigma-70 family)
MDNQALYEACRQHGSDAQIDGFEALSRHLYAVAYAMLRQRPDADLLAADCMQLALIKVHRSLDQCQNPAAFRAWAAQIARRTVLDQLRRPTSRETALPDEGQLLPQQLVVQPPEQPLDVRALLLDAITSGPLSERSQRVVIGRFFDEQSDELLARRESALAKLRGDATLMARLHELLTV